MKIEVKDSKKTVLYINKYIMGDINFDEPISIEKYFRKIVIDLRKCYNYKMNGDYNVKVYIDDFYGAIIELEKFFDYDDFVDNILDLRIILNNNPIILYEIEDYDYFHILGDNIDKYYYKDKFYCAIKKIDINRFIQFLEFSKIIYGEDAIALLKKAKKIK